jgi:hypothetical protein
MLDCSPMIKRFTTILAAALLAVSCSRGVSRIHTRPLPRPNPTSYSFPLPLGDVRTRALQAFSLEQQPGSGIFGPLALAAHVQDLYSALQVECSTNAVFSEAIFRDPANTNDIYLHSFGFPLVVSSVYQGRAGGLPYTAAFHLHLTATGSNTLVTVRVLDAQVFNGEKFGFGQCNGPGYLTFHQKVKPTTVEEYIVLRHLGHYLGVTNMPAVILPTQ